MAQREFVIQKLKELWDGVPEIKTQGVHFCDSAAFSSWRDVVGKWLKSRILHTQDELQLCLDGSLLYPLRYNYTIAEIKFTLAQKMTVAPIPRAVLNVTAQAREARLNVREL